MFSSDVPFSLLVFYSVHQRDYNPHSCHFQKFLWSRWYYRHRGALSVSKQLSCWFPGLPGPRDALSNYQSGLQWRVNKTAAPFQFSVYIPADCSFHVGKLVWVVMFACLCTHLKIIYSCNTNDYLMFFLGDDGLTIFLNSDSLEFYFAFVFPYVP